ncbi:type II toxin-antitoxin system RelE/ParE family toxin [Nostoc spongiaeforme FACHB-130]|uniref:Type II toxin-antitoxin system RelE/ParE family toxin n=1 Tax=Nostoc spongiaeforme FACHB-130 TaxID=1357510 RepID=A0ABR8FTP6_9NOSO|nr:type II toxin-antitoxin system RelE/ParE family toxin [Nostoc spongiaeforme]MBD2594707.1 type II toxin-antitoxin system RelE/ParE family toxin [Nostoc spongiaeforme FACHB-130]
MNKVSKRPQVIHDLLEIATYIGEDNLEASDRFLIAAEKTFQQLGQMPGMGRYCQLSHPKLAGIRQQAIKGFPKYFVFYLSNDSGVEILRVIYGGRDIEAILYEDLEEDNAQ